MMTLAMPQLDSRAKGDRDDLLARCRAGDRAAFRTFVHEHQRMVFACLSRMLGAGSHVEDLAQETFLRAYRAFDRFDVNGPAKVSTWLLTIATHAALDWKKKRRLTLVPIETADAAGASSPTTPESEHARTQLAGDLERAAATLNGDQRIALVLADLHGLSLAEIARATSVPEATVKTRLFRARERMRAELKEEWRPHG